MPIPQTRTDLTLQIESSYTKLRAELDAADPNIAELPCVDEWNVTQLLIVRAWWTERVIAWVEAGLRGEIPVTPAPGYRWNETPRLNTDVIDKHAGESYRSVRARLERGYRRAIREARNKPD